MKTLRFTAVLMVSVVFSITGTFGCGGSTNVSSRSASGGLRPDGGRAVDPNVPRWLPPYSDAQLALLQVALGTPVRWPAQRVFPGEGRFRHASNHRMEDLDEATSFTRLVATVVRDSPHLYVISDAPPGVENIEAQYGPKPLMEPDAWTAVAHRLDGSPTIIRTLLQPYAQADFDRAGGLDWRRNPDKKLVIEALRATLEKSPGVPALLVELGEALTMTGDQSGAFDAYKGAVENDATLATGYAGLAEIYEKRGELRSARRETIRALSYYPSSRRANALAERLAYAGVKASRIAPYGLFLDVTETGAVRVAASGGEPGQVYGSCRAIMRYEPRVRAALFEQPVEMPYALSATEEIICLEAAIGTYVALRRSGRGTPPNAHAEALLQLARSEGLLGYVMFEIIGQHRPEEARQAPRDVHQAIVDYVTKHVIGEHEELPDGLYNAMATPP